MEDGIIKIGKKILLSLVVLIIMCSCGYVGFTLWYFNLSRNDLQSLKFKGRELNRSLTCVENFGDLNIKKGYGIYPVEESLDFSNSTDYFCYVMDMKNYDKTNWQPLIHGPVRSSVFRNLNKSNLEDETMWSVAKNISATTDKNIPVLVSRNVDVSQLYGKFTAKQKDEAFKSYGGYVLIRKDGSMYMQKRSKLSARYIYRKGNFDYTTNAVTPEKVLKYLTPTSEVYPRQN